MSFSEFKILIRAFKRYVSIFFYISNKMKIDLNYIANIKTLQELKKYDLDKPIFMNNYLFHYLILLGNLNGLKLYKFKIFEYNEDGLSGFSLASKLPDTDILEYLIETYPDYIYNVDKKQCKFTFYLEFDNVIKLMKKYNDLDWTDLFVNSHFKESFPYIFFNNATYEQISTVLKIIKPEYIYNTWISSNTNIDYNDKIKIFDKLSFEELNKKPFNNTGVLATAIYSNNVKLFDYLLEKNVDFDYGFKFEDDPNKLLYSNILNVAVLSDLINDKLYYSKKLVELAKKKYSKEEFYNYIHQINSFGFNILHVIFSYRLNSNPLKKINKIDEYFIELLGEDGLNHNNDNKIAPIEWLVKYNKNLYYDLIKKYKIEKSIYEKIKDKIKIDAKPDEHKSKLDMKEIKSNYIGYNVFDSKTYDAVLYSYIISKKYNNVLLLKHNKINPEINNIDFPFILIYNYPDELYMNKYLTKLINDNKKGDKRFFFIFMSINHKDFLHANILIGDYKNNTIEHFETYGSLYSYTSKELLEEELTWSTGMQFIKPNDFLPNIGFQALSDNKSIENRKHGDLDGYCLAWCFWYLESRLLNPNINPKDLINKLMKMISKSDYNFLEHIRNYANKLTNEKFKILENLRVSKNEILNINMSDENIKKIYNFVYEN